MVFRLVLVILLIGALPGVACAQTTGSSARWTDPAAQQAALTLARRAFDAYALRREVIEPPSPLPRLFQDPAAVFVSAMRADGSPRCCMGSLYPTQPNAAEEIIESAVAAAGHDRRFPPLRATELPRLTLIVSFVDRPSPITAADAARLDPVTQGLAVQNGDRWGVVLSGETPRRENLPRWGRIRAGAGPNDAVQWFAIRDVRMKESRPTMKNFLHVAAVFLLLFTALSGHAATPQAKAVKPNLDVFTYRRSYVPGEKVLLRLSVYNIKSASFTAYRMDLPGTVKNSAGLTDFGKTLKALNVSRLPAAAAWRFAVGKTYPDQWAERTVPLPRLPPGVYLIAARAGGVEKRTWLDITAVALLAKRSRQETLVSAMDAETGAPIAGLALTVYGGHGPTGRVVTDADGVCRFPAPSPDAVWVYGEHAGSPAFALASMPPAADPYSVYPLTDRPIYRPGQTVQYKAVIRSRTPAPVPGGVSLKPLANAPVVVEIRDATDALLSQADRHDQRLRVACRLL